MITPSHLPAHHPVDENARYWEECSIEARDLFGTIVAEKVGVPADPDWDTGSGNPFAKFLRVSLASVSGSEEKLRWSPRLWPDYEICKEEAAAVVGGDANATRAIIHGDVALHAMPPDVRKASPAEKAAWVRAELSSKSDKDSFLDRMIDHIIESDDLDRGTDVPGAEQGNSGPAISNGGATP